MSTAYQTADIPMIDDTGPIDESRPTVKATFVKMRSANSGAEMLALLFALCGIISGTICLAVLVTILSLIPLYLLIVGSINVHNCHGQRYIPIFMIVTGVFSLLRVLLDYYFRWRRRKSSVPISDEEAGRPSPFSGIISLFLFAWLIAGTIWVFNLPVDYYNTGSENYCDKLTYLSAYIFIIASWSVLAILLFIMACICCFGCIAVIFK